MDMEAGFSTAWSVAPLTPCVVGGSTILKNDYDGKYYVMCILSQLQS